MLANSNYIKEIDVTFFCLVIVRQRKEYLRQKKQASKVEFADIYRVLFLHTRKTKWLSSTQSLCLMSQKSFFGGKGATGITFTAMKVHRQCLNQSCY